MKKVSICCITYNQEKYIKDAIESFLNQKTNFSYEIIIHDDASTDNTKKIIEEYQKKYPDIIIPIYEQENIYYKNPNTITDIVFSKASGEYIALCDGDDYWTCENKLQMQVDIMDQNKDLTLCSHNTYIVNNDKKILQKYIPYSKNDITIKDFLTTDQSMHTSSMFFRRKDLKKFPKDYYEATVGDLPLKLYLLSLGNAYHINKIMSAYRHNSTGSWSLAQKNNLHKYLANYEMELKVYENFNERTNQKYNEYITKKILQKEFNYHLKFNHYEEIFKEKYHSLYQSLPLKAKLKLQIKKIINY